MTHVNGPSIQNFTEFILKQIEERASKKVNKQISDEELLSLHSIFGVTLQKALDILEKYPTFTTYVTSTKLRALIEINGENDRCYRLFPRLNYCPCQAFRKLVIEKIAEVTCKHVLAARIAQILGRTVVHEVTQDQYLMLLKSMYHIE